MYKRVYQGTYHEDKAWLVRKDAALEVFVTDLIDPSLDGKRVRVTVEELPEQGVVDEALEEVATGPKFKMPKPPKDDA